MVTRGKRRLRATAAALLAAAGLAATLSGCKLVTALFSWSMFPSFLSGVEATRDLSRELDDLLPEGSTDWGVDITALRSRTWLRDYVFLAVSTPGGSRLLVLDSNLDVINTVNGEPTGGRSLIDADGNFALGRVLLEDTVDGPIEAPLRTDLPGEWYPFFFADPSNWNFGLRQIAPNQLEYAQYTPGWAGGPAGTPTIDAAGTFWNLVGADLLPSRAGEELMIAVWSWDRQEVAVVFADRTLLAGAFPGPLIDTSVDPPVSLLASGFFVKLRDEEPKRVHYTAKGVLVRTHDREATLYDFDGTRRLRINLGENEIADCYTEDGERFYYFDRDRRILYKGRTGW
jgi:hypothetical protein